MPEFHSTVSDTIWREGGVRCVMVPSGVGTAVELPTDQGTVFLRKQAPTITAARNEAEFLRLLLRRAGELIPDLIILDYRLPDLHGRDLCRQLRANPDAMQVPILVVTASRQDNPDSDDPDAVLTKPCLLPTLAASRLLLRRVLAAPSRPAAPTA